MSRTILKNTSIAALAVAAFASFSTSAMAFSPPAKLSNGPNKPQVVWDHAAWKNCWSKSYVQARTDGHSPNGATAYADLVCGDPPL